MSPAPQALCQYRHMSLWTTTECHRKSYFPHPIKRIFLWLKLALVQHRRQCQELHLGCSSQHLHHFFPLATSVRHNCQATASSKTGDPNDPFFLIIDCWAGTSGKEEGCFSTIVVPMVKKQSKTTGWSLLFQHVFMYWEGEGMGIQSNDLAVGLLPFYGFSQRAGILKVHWPWMEWLTGW